MLKRRAVFQWMLAEEINRGLKATCSNIILDICPVKNITLTVISANILITQKDLKTNHILISFSAIAETIKQVITS